jgi:anti-sigma regulatory factor (Ser/Thr protein kinase)
MMHTPIRVAERSDIANARRACVGCATRLGFDESDAGRVAIVVTELATNLVKHGGGGEILFGGEGDDGEVATVEMIALDKGPGMADVGQCLRDGYSTAGSPGTGLGAAERQSDAFDLFSAPGLGAAVLARLRPRRRPEPPGDAIRRRTAGAGLRVGGVNVPVRGESVSGDGWAAVTPPAAGEGAGRERLMLLVADGLGHGPLAAAASAEAARLFRAHQTEQPAELAETIHLGLRATRGAAIAVVGIDPDRAVVTVCGIGNIAGAILSGGQVRRMVSISGTAGLVARKFQEFAYPIAGAGSGGREPFLVVMHSDGLVSQWSLDRYPGIATRDPALIAAVLYRDYARGRDDTAVVVVKGGGAG